MNTTPADFPTLENWRLELDSAGLCWLAVDKHNAGTNVLSRAVMQELDTALEAIERINPKGLIVYSAKAGGFIAGADVHEFPSIRSEDEAVMLAREGQRIFRRLERLPCPSVAVINGNALGGGLELALAATRRIGLESAQPCLGLPEIQLGLHPGFGGTVRAVRLLGVRQAMGLMLTGRSVTIAQGIAYGLLDGIATDATWRDQARQILGLRPSRRRQPLVDALLGLGMVRGFVADSLVRRARRKADPAHYPAPFALIELWRQFGATGDDAYEAEARSFGKLAVTDTAKNLLRVFFLQDNLKRLASRVDKPVAHVHVVGAGVMGGDIAAWCAVRGLTVTLQDRELKYVEPALARAHKLFVRKFPEAGARALATSRLTADVEGAGVPMADVVIEAIFENLEAKQKLLGQIESRLKPGCILATNTSSIPLEDLMTCLSDPGRLIGLHFFNPVAKLPLVEVVRTKATSRAALEAGLAFTRQIGKLPVPCRSHPGFLVNRILAPYLAEAMSMVQEGVPLSDIDAAATEFGMPMGPVELADSVGLDIALNVARILAPVLNRPVAPELEHMVKAGHLGRKTGRGFYVYQEGKPVRPRTSERSGSRDIQDRLVLALLNEAAHCLAEGIVAEVDLIDAAVIFGTGFAPFRGGPLHYARQQGIDTITARLAEFAARFGPRFTPSAGWQRV